MFQAKDDKWNIATETDTGEWALLVKPENVAAFEDWFKVRKQNSYSALQEILLQDGSNVVQIDGYLVYIVTM